MKDLLWINRWDGRRKNSAKEKQTIGQSFISNYNITDFKQVLSELWVGLAMNIGSENSRYVTFIPPTINEVIKLRISDHPSLGISVKIISEGEKRIEFGKVYHCVSLFGYISITNNIQNFHDFCKKNTIKISKFDKNSLIF